jgi:hypothetical protein
MNEKKQKNLDDMDNDDDDDIVVPRSKIDSLEADISFCNK